MYRCPKAHQRRTKGRAGMNTAVKSAFKKLAKAGKSFMSEGSRSINTIISFARGENWRGKAKKTTRRRATTRKRAASRKKK